ncbi:MAG: hypothetical protein JO037_15840 [Actinobacteria bacterium]|nr:hypothetical protein [Actinomycetota bacterium]
MSRGPARVLASGVALVCAGLAAGCGTRAVGVTGAGPPPVTAAPLSTSLVTAQGTWAIAVMGGAAGSEDSFWQLFVRRAGAGGWSLVTPPGVADNGGLVAAGGATSLTVGVRPSQHLTFSPLATSTDAGRNWTPGLLDAGLADTPGAIAVGPSGRTLALLQDGTIQAAQMTGNGEAGGTATAGQWSRLTSRDALAASAAGRECGLVSVQAVAFGPDGNPVAAGRCVRPGVAGVFTDDGGSWRSAGLVLPGADPVQVLRLARGAGGIVALLLAGNGLFAAWWDGTRWTVSAPVRAGRVTAGSLRAAGFGPGGSAWLLLGGGRAETIGGPGASWRSLPSVPPGTATLAPPDSGPGPGAAEDSYDALAVAGSRLTVWRLVQAAWTKVQLINVPVQYGSSG